MPNKGVTLTIQKRSEERRVGKEWDKAWFLTIGLTMDIPELEVNIGRRGALRH